MVFTPGISWAYKDEAVSTKLQGMVDNLVAHDHRADGSQGAPFVGEWKPADSVAAAAGFAVPTKRYRLLFGGKLVSYDFTIQRTGADINFPSSGNLTDVTMLTGIPSEARVENMPIAVSVNSGPPAMLYATADTIRLVGGVPGGTFANGQSVIVRAVLWRE